MGFDLELSLRVIVFNFSYKLLQYKRKIFVPKFIPIRSWVSEISWVSQGVDLGFILPSKKVASQV